MGRGVQKPLSNWLRLDVFMPTSEQQMKFNTMPEMPLSPAREFITAWARDVCMQVRFGPHFASRALA